MTVIRLSQKEESGVMCLDDKHFMNSGNQYLEIDLSSEMEIIINRIRRDFIRHHRSFLRYRVSP